MNTWKNRMNRFLSICLVYPGLAIGQEPVSADLIGGELNEVVQPEVSVSGNVIVGVMSAAAAPAILSDQIEARGLDTTQSNVVCLRVASNDGIYTSRNAYGVPDAATVAHLPYDTNKEEVVRPYADSAGQLVLSATSGDCGTGSSAYHVVSSSESSDDAAVFIYINSFGATDVFYEILSNTQENDSEPCEYISEGRRTMYDYFCRIDADAIGVEADIAIIRERFGREQPTIELKVTGATQ